MSGLIFERSLEIVCEYCKFPTSLCTSILDSLTPPALQEKTSKPPSTTLSYFFGRPSMLRSVGKRLLDSVAQVQRVRDVHVRAWQSDSLFRRIPRRNTFRSTTPVVSGPKEACMGLVVFESYPCIPCASPMAIIPLVVYGEGLRLRAPFPGPSSPQEMCPGERKTCIISW
jgi:hypothetical protein